MKSIALTPQLHEYLVSHSMPPDAILQELIIETHKLDNGAARMIPPEEGSLLTMLTRMIGAKKAIEIGTFTGYSSLCIARGLEENGTLLCCDINAEWGRTAQRYWQKAGLANQITLKIAPALETLRQLSDTPDFDLAFIDADKENYLNYYEEILRRTRVGGVILVDNTLWKGLIVDQSDMDPTTQAIKEFNDYVASDNRVYCMILNIADGLTILRKR